MLTITAKRATIDEDFWTTIAEEISQSDKGDLTALALLTALLGSKEDGHGG